MARKQSRKRVHVGGSLPFSVQFLSKFKPSCEAHAPINRSSKHFCQLTFVIFTQIFKGIDMNLPLVQKMAASYYLLQNIQTSDVAPTLPVGIGLTHGPWFFSCYDIFIDFLCSDDEYLTWAEFLVNYFTQLFGFNFQTFPEEGDFFLTNGPSKSGKQWAVAYSLAPERL